MAGSVNKVILVGHLGADPEVRTLPSGGKVANFSVATSERWTDKNSGEKKERTEWHRIAVFGNGESGGLAGLAEKYLKKGSAVYLEGQLQTRKWQDQSGQDKYSTEVVLNGFGANITLLDRSEGGNRPPSANSPDDYGRTSTRGGDGGSAAPGADEPERPPAATPEPANDIASADRPMHPSGRQYWLVNGAGEYLNRYCLGFTRDRREAWTGNAMQLVACRRKFEIARDLSNKPVEKEQAAPINRAVA